MYSPQLLDHFQTPRNAGEITDPDASVQLENPACGDILKLTLRVTDGRIAEIRFLAKGCVPAMACGSLLTELVQGDRKSTRLNSSHSQISYAVFCLKKKKKNQSEYSCDLAAIHPLDLSSHTSVVT